MLFYILVKYASVRGAFQVLFDLKLKEDFYKDLNRTLQEADYKIIGVGINKEEHIKNTGIRLMILTASRCILLSNG